MDVNSKDSINLKEDENNYTLEFNNGNVILFTSQNETINSKNSFIDGYSTLKIINNETFEVHDKKSNEVLGKFKLYAKPGWFIKLIQILASVALFTSVFQAYLKVNKVWKRRTITEVANSISPVASLLGFAVLLPFLLNNLFISNDFPSAGKSLIGLFLALLFTLISTGYYLEENRGKSLF